MSKEREKSSFFSRLPLMVVHLMKASPHGKSSVIADSVICFFRFAWWKFSFAIIGPLNTFRETSFFTAIRKWTGKVVFKKYFFEVSLPENLEPQHRGRFSNNFYLLKPLRILPLKDHWIYLTAYHGIVFKNFRILPESIHGKWDRRNVSLLQEYFPLASDSWMYAYHERSNAITELTDETNYLLAHHWFNYYHWLTETVLRLWRAKDLLHEHVVLLPESLREIRFVRQSLEALDIRNVRYVKEGAMRVKHLTLVENKPYCNHYFPELCQNIGAYFSDYVRTKSIPAPGFGDKIFISRKKAERRKLVNEDEVERLLSEYGFKSVDFEDFDFFQQVAILGKARYLIGMHGAGLTNMLFMPKGSKVLEFHREIYSRDDLHSDVYWKLASALGHHYYYQFCEAESKDEDFFTANYRVDLGRLKINMRRLI